MEPHTYGVIHEESSPYGSYRIVDMHYEGRPSRMLFGDNDSPQSGMAVDDNPELLFDYNQRFLEMIMSQKPSTALVIGGGVMMLPKAAYELFSNLQIDVVEIDELLIKLARDHFELPDNPRLRTHATDGIDFVKSTSKSYDIIIIDAFLSYSIPPHLVDADAALEYKNALNADGLVAINLISEYKAGRPSLAHRMVDNFSRHFKHIEIYQSDPTDIRGRDQNMLLVASDSEFSLDYLQSKSLELLD
jgi:spermidine synthase